MVREEARLYRILFNSAGYFQFSYYYVKDGKKSTGKLPFDTSAVVVPGK